MAAVGRHPLRAALTGGLSCAAAALALAGCEDVHDRLITVRTAVPGDFSILRISASAPASPSRPLPRLRLEPHGSGSAGVRALAGISPTSHIAGSARASAIVVVIYRRTGGSQARGSEVELRVTFGDGNDASLSWRLEGTMRGHADAPACGRASLALSQSTRFLELVPDRDRRFVPRTGARQALQYALQQVCGPLTPALLAWVHREVDPGYLRA